ncbi:MAG: FlgD immunoglobulin-like domain containing protein [Candidatus Edwardsbacteria bacterium]|nr:FlgD immunoglobulin-like domain containing protein [Candidatus Edwardsbacteria bacterium]
MLTWAANCLTNDTLQWEIWVDNGNGLFDSLGVNQDLQLFVYSVSNGDTLGGRGLPDTTAVLDNEIVNALKNGFAPTLYWMRAVSLVDGSSAFDSVRVTPMVSPWATVSGHVHVPGDSVLQKNLWVEADIYFGDNAFWAALTDSFGNYTINMDNTYLDTLWDIGGLNDLSGGYIAPADTTIRVNGGNYNDVNFDYTAATDSVTGEVRDELGTPLSITAYVYAQQDSREKDTQTSGSHYQLFFSTADTGTWRLGCGWDGNAPYMNPSEFDIQPAGVGHIIHDFKAYRATDSIKGTVTEQGGVSSRVYRIYAWSDSLQISSSTLTDPSTGAYKLMVSDSTDYNVGIDTWSEEYPIPDGWTVNPSGYSNVNPPATEKNFDLSPATEFIEGQITQDPGDAQLADYDQIWLQAWPTSGGSGFQTQPNISGQYSIPAMPDTYDVGAGYNNNGRFLFQPSRYQSLIVHPNDTLRNNDFLANYGHCQVEVTLTGYPLATQNWMGASDNNSWPNGYQTNVEVDSSGTYNLYICNSTGWNVWAPGIAGYDVSPGSYYLGDIFHSDTYRGVLTFIYTPTGVEGNPKDRLMPTVFKLSQNHPNPVRSIVSISYQLPKPAKVSMTIYNILGQAVKSFDEGSKEAGYYNIKWDGRDDRNSLLGNGIYFYRLQAGEFVATKKMVLMR